MGNRASVIIGVLLVVVGSIALIVWSSMGLVQHTGEVCITYNGRTDCRVASGQTREEAIRTATDMACSSLAAGMTDRINCSNTDPSSVTWQE